MAQITKEITVDVAKRNLFQAIVAKQNDTDSRYLKATICNDGAKIEVPAAATAVLNVLRADGQAKAYAGTVNSDGTVTVPLPAWALALDDTVACSISIIAGDTQKLTTTSFSIDVQQAEYEGDNVSEDENYDLLVSLIGECKSATASALAAAAGEKMQLIRQITTTAEAQTLSLNKDNSDAAFSCDKVFLIVQFPEAIKLGTGGQTFYITETTGKTRYLYYASTAHTTLILRMTAEVLGAESDAAAGMTQIAFSQYDWSEDSINFGRTASGLTAIKSLVVGFEGSYKIPVGTTITLYGRRA